MEALSRLATVMSRLDERVDPEIYLLADFRDIYLGDARRSGNVGLRSAAVGDFVVDEEVAVGREIELGTAGHGKLGSKFKVQCSMFKVVRCRGVIIHTFSSSADWAVRVKEV